MNDKERYIPAPIICDSKEIPNNILGIIEVSTRNVHEVWTARRMEVW